MFNIQIIPDIYWVGAIDWNIRNFHGFTYITKSGTTYNAYLIIDDKVTLVDTVYGPFAEDMIHSITRIINPVKINYIIMNHVETDHSGAVADIIKLCPNARIFGTEKCKQGLYKNYYLKLDFQAVKTGDKLRLGKRTLTFLEAPMIHWPDSMFTYVIEDGILMPNDAFGQHYATSERYDDEVNQYELMDEAAAYYANILLPFSPLILKKIEEVVKMGIPINMIAPSHGIIWRNDPMRIVQAYMKWARNETNQKVIIVYETMYKSTERMARKIAEGIIDSGVEVKLFDINQSDRTTVIKEMLDAKGYIIGSSTHDNDMLPAISGFLNFLKGLKPKNRIASAFGSYGWAGGSTKGIEGLLKSAGIEMVQPSLEIQFVPDADEEIKCYEYGKSFVGKIK